jgi:tRNA (Thr-GGU) A37 N-methylase
MNHIVVSPVGWVRGRRVENIDDDWGSVESEIVLDETRLTAEALQGLNCFSHAVIVFVFDRIDPADIANGARRPRGNPAWPSVGIFAQRGSPRPNRLGVTTAEIRSVQGVRLLVRGLDALDGTPVLDIKPAMSGFDLRAPLSEPAWAKDIMQGYWTS